MWVLDDYGHKYILFVDVNYSPSNIFPDGNNNFVVDKTNKLHEIKMERYEKRSIE